MKDETLQCQAAALRKGNTTIMWLMCERVILFTLHKYRTKKSYEGQERESS
jgi:hypothetical protein